MDKGAHWHRCDFQVHTPRDPNWSGAKPDTEDERKKIAAQLVAACRQKGIDAVAITDHHDFAYIPIVREAALTEVDERDQPISDANRLVVFPGLELTLGVPCQALLILDANFPIEQLSVVLDSLAIPIIDPELPSLPSVERIDHIQSLEQLHVELDRHSWLRGNYIVLPNVTDGGLGTLMRAGMQAKYKEMPCVGGYLDGTVTERVGEGNQRIFEGQDAAWGNKRIALVQTSDSRSETFGEVGKHSAWVKWATPTAEALRQACLAQESRIAHEPPALPSIHLTRLSVSNSKFMGPIELELNPQYNAIIGGRGTGKSTCLEYIRWALCDQPTAGTPDDELSDHATRRQRLISTTLEPFGGHVDVHFLLNGIAHVVRRHAGAEGTILKVGDGEFGPASEEDVRSLLPIHAYSQKQLSSVSVRLDEVTRFVTSPIRSQLDQIATQSTGLAGRIRENYAVLQRQRSLAIAAARDELASNSLVQQAANLRESLGAISDEDRECLGEKPRQDIADEYAVGIERRLLQAVAETANFNARIQELRRELKPPPSDDLPNYDVLQGLETAAASAFDELQAAAQRAEEILAIARASGSAFETLLASWRAAHAEFEETYASAKERSASHQSKLDELGELEQRSRRLRDAVTSQREELARLSDPLAEHSRLRSEWRRIQIDRSECLAQQCEELTELSGGLVRATLRRGAGLISIGDQVRSAVTGSGVRGAKIDAFVDALIADDDPVSTWESVLEELEPGHEEAEGPAQTEPTTVIRLGFSSLDIEKMVNRITPEAWLGLALAPVEDHPSFEYQTKDGEYIAFSDASAGQQATALLRVLLNEGGPPLIIDQPEEDLDSQVVLEVVERIWTAKTRRQLIFASHNPNLVVNGDAELVISCDYRAAGDHSGGRIKLEGAIDVPEMKTEITAVMEGGEKAFRLRKEKYGF